MAASNWALLPLDGISVCTNAAFVFLPEGWRNSSDDQPQLFAVSCRWAQSPEGLLSPLSLQGGLNVSSEAF